MIALVLEVLKSQSNIQFFSPKKRHHHACCQWLVKGDTKFQATKTLGLSKSTKLSQFEVEKEVVMVWEDSTPCQRWQTSFQSGLDDTEPPSGRGGSENPFCHVTTHKKKYAGQEEVKICFARQLHWFSPPSSVDTSLSTPSTPHVTPLKY